MKLLPDCLHCLPRRNPYSKPYCPGHPRILLNPSTLLIASIPQDIALHTAKCYASAIGRKERKQSKSKTGAFSCWPLVTLEGQSAWCYATYICNYICPLPDIEGLNVQGSKVGKLHLFSQILNCKPTIQVLGRVRGGTSELHHAEF